MPHTYLTANVYCRRIFGDKVYKLALTSSTSCLNRDGTVGVGGCVFCSTGGSGDFAASAVFPVSRQIDEAKRILGDKGEGLKYIAYFQSYTGIYGDLVLLERIYTEAVEHPDIVGLSIATRPDCLARYIGNAGATGSEKAPLGGGGCRPQTRRRQNVSTAVIHFWPMRRQWQT